jgi:tetratricopeptide (TPR) repeat protein
MSASEPEPVPSNGDLEDFPLASLVMHVFQKNASGTLFLEADETKTWIHFDEGKPSAVHSPNAQIYLGMVLREQGLIDDMVFNDSLMKMAESGKLQGEVLVEMGAVSQEQIDQAIEVQHLRKISQLFNMREGEFRFKAQNACPGVATCRQVHPYAVIYNGICNCYEEEDLFEELVDLENMLVGAGSDLAEFKQAVQLGEDELGDLNLLAQHRLPKDFANRARTGQTAARMLLLALHHCDMLLVTDPAKAPAPPSPAPNEKRARPKPVPERPASAPAQQTAVEEQPTETKAPAGPRRGATAHPPQALPPAALERIERKHNQAKDHNLLGLLDLAVDSTPDQAKKAFEALSKIYHPDRFARFNDPELVKKVNLIAAKLNEAREVLRDPQMRADYLTQMVGGEARPITVNPDAADIAYTKAKVYLQKNLLDKALDALKMATRFDPSKAAFKARLLWTEFILAEQAGESPDEGLRLKLRRDLAPLVKQSPSNFWANRHLAMICGLLGEAEDHERYLEKANRIRPQNVENARELRLLKMRKGKAVEKDRGFLRRKKS